MGTEQHGKKVQCVLCQTSEENPTTGPLSTKGSVTAHENCLLYSSGIICQNSPEFDDLFGFSEEDVLKEIKRGNRLICYRCKKKGATVGCEVKRCKKSYHYPCAVRDGAQNVDDHREEKFTLYCQKHHPEMAATNGTVSRALSFNGDSNTEVNNNGETSPKLFCLVCEKKEETVSLEHIDSGIVKPYCEKHELQSLQKELDGLDAVAGPSSHNSDSNMSSKRRQKQTPKRRLSPSSTQEVKSSKKRIQEDFSDSDGDENGIDMELAPLESDLEDSVNSEHRNHAEAPTTGSQPEPENGDNSDSDTVIDSDAVSQSLLLSVASEEPSQGTNLSVCSSEPCEPGQAAEPVLSGRHGSSLTLGPAHDPISSVHSGPLIVTSTPTRTSPPVSHVPPGCCFIPVSSPPSPSPHSVSKRPPAGPGGLGSPVGSDSEASRVFWSRCNEAGCTESIFNTFISDMVSISNRILSNKASQEDFDLSLRVMEASGKLSQMLSEQEREFEKKLNKLERATAAIRDARSALKR
ncbi:uncharacterized protein LOC121536529 isoform X4 [Coregonus clupeaformis]|uniref:uncharacterized protein LOC121536529 isoform X4 n=1 Tax=Coregonus clupeaformis TaxID=59861 RepID=UPI001BE0B19E|nr:uncharacterized protein LOC121536529 isoform X4 [Coregonus clupeaformis]